MSKTQLNLFFGDLLKLFIACMMGFLANLILFGKTTNFQTIKEIKDEQVRQKTELVQMKTQQLTKEDMISINEALLDKFELHLQEKYNIHSKE